MASKTPAAKPKSTSTPAKAAKPQRAPETVNSLGALKEYLTGRDVNGDPTENKFDEAVARGDGYSLNWRLIQIEDGFNPRDYTKARVKEHIRRMADGYKRGDVFPPLQIIVRNGIPYVRDGHCRIMSMELATSEGAKIGKHAVVEFKGDETAQNGLILKSNDGLTLPALERSVVYARYHAWGWSDADIGKEFGRTSEHVRGHRQLLELPVALKKLIEDDVIKATLALELYRDYGTNAVGMVDKALKDREEEQRTSQIKAGLKALDTEGALDQAKLPLEQETENRADDQVEVDSASAQQGASDEPPALPPIKLTKKHVLKSAGVAPKLTKKVVEAMTRSFTSLTTRLASAKIEGDKVLIEITAEDYELLTSLKAQLAGSEHDTDGGEEGDAQLDILKDGRAGDGGTVH